MPSSVPFWHWDDDPADLIAVLARGGVLAIPTESSYGLAVDPLDARGVAAVFAVKGRAGGEALPVVIADLEQAATLGVDRDAPGLREVASRWPAALSIVVPIPHAIPASAGDPSIAIRVPDHARLRSLLARTGPLTATSANRTGEPPLLDPVAVAKLLAGVDSLVVDGGPLAGGTPSTLVRWVSGGFRVLRAGSYPLDRLPKGAS
jgi:L-threonylcarbamoyladenylate synthase